MNATSHPPARYIEVRFAVPRTLADQVCDFVVENICSGVIFEGDDDAPELGLIFYVPEAERAACRPLLDGYLQELVGLGLSELPSIRERPIEDVEWEEAYKSSVVPVTLAGDVVVRPPWAQAPQPGMIDLVIEPRMAFGTGKHDTTRSCIKVIRELLRPGARFLDLGCGSGILSILAAKMSAGFIKAIDYDVAAVANCQENFRINDVTTPCEVLFGSIDKAALDQPYDFVVANIIKSTILPVLPQLAALTRPGGTLLLSGLLAVEDGEFAPALHAAGLTDYLVVPDNEWLTYVIRKM